MKFLSRPTRLSPAKKNAFASIESIRHVALPYIPSYPSYQAERLVVNERGITKNRQTEARIDYIELLSRRRGAMIGVYGSVRRFWLLLFFTTISRGGP